MHGFVCCVFGKYCRFSTKRNETKTKRQRSPVFPFSFFSRWEIETWIKHATTKNNRQNPINIVIIWWCCDANTISTHVSVWWRVSHIFSPKPILNRENCVLRNHIDFTFVSILRTFVKHWRDATIATATATADASDMILDSPHRRINEKYRFVRVCKNTLSTIIQSTTHLNRSTMWKTTTPN